MFLFLLFVNIVYSNKMWVQIIVRAKEIVNVGCKPVDVSDFWAQIIVRAKEIVNVGHKPVDVSDFWAQS